MSDRERKGNLIIPIFIPNRGCPHRCIFCHQEKITSEPGKNSGIQDLLNKIKETVETAIFSDKFSRAEEPQIAFYGGTFTLLPVEEITAILQEIGPYLERGLFTSVRVSTRPDAIDRKKLDLISQLGVTVVELGAQSMDDAVLSRIQRGHTEDDVIQSMVLLKEYGFKTGLQLMPGLPGDSEELFMEGIEKTVRLRPDMVRLYPAVVIKDTGLARMYKNGDFTPLSLERAVKLCADSCIRLETEGIPVIRIGLMSTPSLKEKGVVLAGPWHEAFGHMVRSEIYHREIEPFLMECRGAGNVELHACDRDISLLRGYKNQGLKQVEEKSGAEILTVIGDNSVPAGKIVIRLH